MSSCLMALLAVVALSSFLFTADPKGDLLVSSVKVSVAFSASSMPLNQSSTLHSYFVKDHVRYQHVNNVFLILLHLGIEASV
jgi:signal peptidase complex subunit 3